MNRWTRFWWAHGKAWDKSQRFWWSVGQGWQFATQPGKIRTMTRQIERELARTLDTEYGRLIAG